MIDTQVKFKPIVKRYRRGAIDTFDLMADHGKTVNEHQFGPYAPETLLLDCTLTIGSDSAMETVTYEFTHDPGGLFTVDVPMGGTLVMRPMFSTSDFDELGIHPSELVIEDESYDRVMYGH